MTINKTYNHHNYPNAVDGVGNRYHEVGDNQSSALEDHLFAESQDDCYFDGLG